MQINIKHHDFELTPAIEDYARSKLSTLSKYFKNGEVEIMLDAIIGKTSNHHKHGNHYEVKLSIKRGGENIHVSSIKSDVYASIDEAKDKLEDELAHNVDKKRSLMMRIGRRFKNLIKSNR
jgi:ribosomal subunit interface protein